MKSKNRYLQSISQTVLYLTVILILFLALRGGIVFIDILSRDKAYTPLYNKVSKGKEKLYFHKKFLFNGDCHLTIYQNDIYYCYDQNEKLLWKGDPEKLPYKYVNFYQVAGQKKRDYFFPRHYQVSLKNRQNRVIQVWRYQYRCLSRGFVEYVKTCFIGYNRKGEKIGYIGQTGFNTYPMPGFDKIERCIAIPYKYKKAQGYNLLIQTSKSIFKIDFAKKEVKELFPGLNKKIETFTVQSDAFKEKGSLYQQAVLCHTENNKYYMYVDGFPRYIEINIPSQYEISHLAFAVKDKRIYIRSYSSKLPFIKGFNIWSYMQFFELIYAGCKEHYSFMELDQLGNIRNRKSYSFQMPKRHEFFYEYLKSLNMLNGLAFSSPLVLDMLQNDDTSRFTVIDALRFFKPNGSIFCWLFSAVLLIPLLLHAYPRKTCWGKIAIWSFVTFSFNIAGLLTYYALNHTPLIRCEHCGKLRGLENEQCMYCKQAPSKPDDKKHHGIFEDFS